VDLVMVAYSSVIGSSSNLGTNTQHPIVDKYLTFSNINRGFL